MTGTQYRVLWKREGQSDMRRKHYETLAAALRCVETQRSAAEEIDWANVPPLTFGPVLDARQVGPWWPVVDDNDGPPKGEK